MATDASWPGTQSVALLKTGFLLAVGFFAGGQVLSLAQRLDPGSAVSLALLALVPVGYLLVVRTVLRSETDKTQNRSRRKTMKSLTVTSHQPAGVRLAGRAQMAGGTNDVRYVIGSLLGLLLPAVAIGLIVVRTEEMPRVVSVWPLLAALGASAATWWLQGLIVAVLARPQLGGFRVKDMFRVYMAGTFVALVSPIRGAEIPYEVYLLKRLGLSAGEGSNVVLTRVLLDAAVLTPAALVAAFALYSHALPEVQNPGLLLAAAVVLAAVAFLVRRRVLERAGKGTGPLGGSGWQAKARVKISVFLRDARRSFASYWRPGHRATLAYAVALAVVYWGFRLSAGPLALMAVGWSGDWLPVVGAQLLLASFVLPFVPTPGGGGARELGLAALLSGYVPGGQLLSGIVVHTAVTHWLPLIAGAFFAGQELRRRNVLSGNQEPEKDTAASDDRRAHRAQHLAGEAYELVKALRAILNVEGLYVPSFPAHPHRALDSHGLHRFGAAQRLHEERLCVR